MRARRVLVSAIVLLAWWPVGLFLYADQFSETDRRGGEILLVSAWLALAFAAILLAVALRKRRR